MKKVLLTEGGAAGHMAHPFDLDYVKTGQDLLDFFIDKVPTYLETNVPVIKTDGVSNLSPKPTFMERKKRNLLLIEAVKRLSISRESLLTALESVLPRGTGCGRQLLTYLLP